MSSCGPITIRLELITQRRYLRWRSGPDSLGTGGQCLDDWPSGWDLADPLPEGVAPERLREMLDAAHDAEPADLPDGFI